MMSQSLSKPAFNAGGKSNIGYNINNHIQYNRRVPVVDLGGSINHEKLGYYSSDMERLNDYYHKMSLYHQSLQKKKARRNIKYLMNTRTKSRSRSRSKSSDNEYIGELKRFRNLIN